MSRSVYRRDGGWRLRWAILVAGDLLAACLAYLLAFVLRTHVPLPLTQGYLPGVRFAEVHHHWPEMLVAQGAVLYFLGLYEVHALTRPRDHVGAVAGDGMCPVALDVPVLGAREELPALCRRHGVDEVIIASDHVWQDELLDALSHSEGARARICVVPSPYEILIGRTEHLRLHDIPLIEVIREPLAGGASAVKRAFDAVLAAVLVLAALPVMALVALSIRLTSPGPVLFFPERVGKDCRPFTMAKFPTMRVDAERKTGPVLASENDPRITWLGRYLRGLRLDELPQLWKDRKSTRLNSSHSQ